MLKGLNQNHGSENNPMFVFNPCEQHIDLCSQSSSLPGWMAGHLAWQKL